MKLSRKNLRKLILKEVMLINEEVKSSNFWEATVANALKNAIGSIAGYEKVLKPIAQDKLKDAFKKAGIIELAHQTSDTTINVDDIIDELRNSQGASMVGEPVTFKEIKKAISDLGA